MGEIKSSEYYNNYYDNSHEYRKPYRESVYYELWKKVMELIEKEPILEVGCGSGQFAQMLFDNDITNYVGFDFSETAIKIAKEKGSQTFFVKNALDPKSYYSTFETILFLEILEHADDIKILSFIPKGKEIILTVPDFDHESHIRYFTSMSDVVSRYGSLIDIAYTEKYKAWYIMKGTKK